MMAVPLHPHRLQGSRSRTARLPRVADPALRVTALNLGVVVDAVRRWHPAFRPTT
jgi:hypothetical protein